MALRAYTTGDTEANLTLERDDGKLISVPVSAFFRPAGWFDIERKALELCHGSVLDVGAGTGTHARWLQGQGIPVTAIDVSREAVAVMKRAGVSDARHADIWDMVGEVFNTILILGRTIGLAGDLAGLHRLLTHLRGLVSSDGQVLLTSLDVFKSHDMDIRDYAEANVSAGRYAGEWRFRERFAGHVGPIVNWLYVDPDSLRQVAADRGWRMRLVQMEDDGNYLAQLVLADSDDHA
jgi:SAM-dependent methyltransferase